MSKSRGCQILEALNKSWEAVYARTGQQPKELFLIHPADMQDIRDAVQDMVTAVTIGTPDIIYGRRVAVDRNALRICL